MRINSLVIASVLLASATAIAQPAGPRDVLTGAQEDLEARAQQRAQARQQQVTDTLGLRQLSGRGVRLAATAADPALPAGTIRITVADLRAQPVEGASIQLGIMYPDQRRESRSAQTNADGVAQFTELPTGESQAYRVNLVQQGTRTSTTPFRLETGRGQVARVVSLPVIDDASRLFGMQFDTQLTFNAGRLHVVQQLRVANGGNGIVRLPDGDDGVRIDLPAGFSAFQTRPSMSDQRVVPDETGFFLRGSIPPGAADVLWGYDIPIPRAASELDLTIGVPMKVMTVQVAAERAPELELVVEGLPAARPHDAGGSPLLITGVRRDPTEGALGTMRITLRNLPGPGPARFVAIGVALLFALLGVYWGAKRVDTRAAASEARAHEREALVDEILALEAEHAAGEIGPEYFERERRQRIDDIAALLKAEQHA